MQFKILTAPVKVNGNKEGWVCGLECVEMELGEPDASGRRRPIEKKDGAKTGRTTKKGVFAGGDIVTGAATVIKAAGADRDAGMAIDKSLKDGEWWDPNAPKPAEGFSVLGSGIPGSEADPPAAGVLVVRCDWRYYGSTMELRRRGG